MKWNKIKVCDNIKEVNVFNICSFQYMVHILGEHEKDSGDDLAKKLMKQ